MIPETKKSAGPSLAIIPEPADVTQPAMPIPSQQHQPQEAKPVLDDKYAQALINMVNANYAKEQALKPKHRFISRRMMWLVIIPTILGIIFFIFISSSMKNESGEQETAKTTDKLIESTEYIQDVSR